MNQEAYRSIDVDVFKEILENELFNSDESKNVDVLKLVKRISTVEIKLQGLDLDIKKESSRIKFKQYGFRVKADFIIETKSDVFENETIIKLIPQTVYELEDVIKKLPLPYCDNGKKLKMLMGDSFERLKIKSKNILRNSANDDQIVHYAKKNIQVAQRNCYDARMFLVKIQKTGNRDAIFLVFMANVFMINVHAYLLKMFSSYYDDTKNEKDKQKAELYDIIDLNVIMEPEIEYKRRNEQKEVEYNFVFPKFKWNLQVNQLLTMIYDLQHEKDGDSHPILEADPKDIQEALNRMFVDRKGKQLNKLTIKTCLSESRSDKRAQGNKRIDVKKYFDL